MIPLPAQARDLLLQHLEEHKAICPEPPGQCREIGNLLAFLAHCMGASASDLRAFPSLLLEYDIRCEANGGCESPRHGEAATR